ARSTLSVAQAVVILRAQTCTKRQAADRLGCCIPTIDNYLLKRRLDGHRIDGGTGGCSVLITRESVDRLLAERAE
ncbi:hypothetical protein, partial [Mycobacterium sp.]|uniref:hypothetical protein n=1 Tax=Mycobacterium sp. TaxID=1785 RepID=UPI003F9E87FB